MIYFVTFFVTSYCAYRAKKGKKIFSVILVLWISLLAGLRHETIGTDVLTYVNSLFETAHRTSFPSFVLGNYQEFGIEPLYSTFTYIVSVFTSNVHVLYFLIEFLIVCLVYSRLFQLKSPKSVGLGIFVFQCLFIGTTFNIMRQSIAMSIIFYATQYIEKKQYFKYIFCLLIAIGFHSSSIMGIMFLVMYILIEKRNTIWTHVLIIAGGCVVTFLYSTVVDFLLKLGLISEKYLRYMGEVNQGFDFMVVLLRLPCLLLILVFYNTYCKKDKIKNSFFVDMLILEIIIAELKIVSTSIYRISMYLAFFKAMAYPELEYVLTKKRNKQIVSFFIIFYCLFVFYVLSVVRGNDDIYPYRLYLYK